MICHPNDALSNQELSILAVLGDRLEKGTDLVLIGRMCGLAIDGPFLNHTNLCVKPGAVLVPIPTP